MNWQHYQPFYRIYLAWHPDSDRSAQLANTLFRHLHGDPDQPLLRIGLGIPLQFRSEPLGSQSEQPRPIDFNASQHSSSFILVDDQMVVSTGWRDTIEQIWLAANKAPGKHTVYGVGLSDSALQINPNFTETNFIRFNDQATDQNPQRRLLRMVLHACCRQLAVIKNGLPTANSPPPVKLFLSHAKHDGEAKALAIRDWIHQDLMLESFFDTKDIASGEHFAKEIDQGLEESALVVLQTDAYGVRPWCQVEVLAAKNKNIPIVLINALSQGEQRSFPYLGNLPTLMWQGETCIPTIIERLLLETLGFLFFLQHTENLKRLKRIPQNACIRPRPPELLTLNQLHQELGDSGLVVYPDPPISAQESNILNQEHQTTRFRTPTYPSLSPESKSMQKPLANRTIGISVSDSPDLTRLGFSPLHQKTALLEITRHLLAQGATVAYGGDLRADGFTLNLIDLCRVYNQETGHKVQKIVNYLAWPLHLDVAIKWQAEHFDWVKLEKLPLPDDLRQRYGLDENKAPAKGTEQHCYIGMCCLSSMRERMTADIDARIVLGGKTNGFAGKFPGLAEEAWLSLRAGIPTFILGAFGGCAGAIGEALCGEQPASFKLENQITANQDYSTAVRYYNEQMDLTATAAQKIDYQSLLEDFNQIGFKGCNNGLNEADCLRLFRTEDLEEMIFLIQQGLFALC